MAKNSRVPRPRRDDEYELVFASNAAAKGWRDLVAVRRNLMADTWDFLSRTPCAVTPRNYPLKGALGTVMRGGERFERWQHKPSEKWAPRIWFYVDDRRVVLEQVHTSHPKETE